MTHMLKLLYRGGHLYGEGGIGWREYDIAPHLTIEHAAETRDLPGFVEGGTTYESHHFWVHFLQYDRNGKPERDDAEDRRDSSVLIRVNHGGGWEVWRGDYMLARALRRYGDNDRGLFLLCWYLIDTANYSKQAGRAEAAQEYKQAFVDGRLKKRKLPARGVHKVWIEPPPAVAATAA